MHKRLIISVCLSLLLIMSLVACAGNGVKPSQQSFKAPVVTLNRVEVAHYWGYWFYGPKVEVTRGKAGANGAPLDLNFVFDIENPNPYPVAMENFNFTVAFEDFECPFSEEAFPIIRRVLSEYQDKIYFVYRDFPIISEHAHAQKAAEAAECANAQGKFWPYHDKLFQNQDHLADEYLTLYARQVGLDIEKFSACFASRKFTNEVQADYRDGIATGVRGTPTFFINGRKIEGVLSYDLFQEVIQKVSGKK